MHGNPFRPTRYEHHSKPLLWLSNQARQLEGESSYYISGTRGSGKTSLLKALHWKERLDNKALRDQLKKEDTHFLSVYFRIPDHISYSYSLINWDEVLPSAPDPAAVSFSYFATMVEAISAQLICEAIAEERAVGKRKFSAKSAEEFIESFLNKYSDLLNFTHIDKVTDYNQLASVFDQLHRK